MPTTLNAAEWAIIHGLLRDYYDDLDSQLDRPQARPDLGPTPEDASLEADYSAVEALLKILPATGPVTIVGFVSPAREQVAA